MDKKFFNRPRHIETPDTTNVSYMDEYPHIEQRLRLRRQATARPLGYAAVLRFDRTLSDHEELRQLMEQPPQESRHLPDDSA